MILKASITVSICVLSSFLVASENTNIDINRLKPESAIKTLLSEADKLYKSGMKAVRASKTSADVSDALESSKEAFRNWATSVDDVEVVVPTRVLNVVKDSRFGTYYVVLALPRDLQRFAGNSSKPTVALASTRIEITGEQKELLKINDKIEITGRLHCVYDAWVRVSGGKSVLATSGDPDGYAAPLKNAMFTCYFGSDVFTGKQRNFTKPNRLEFVTFVLHDAEIIESSLPKDATKQ